MVTTAHYLNAVIALRHDMADGIDKAMKGIEKEGLPPDAEIPPEWLTDFDKAVREATEKMFSSASERKAIKDLLSRVLDHMGKRPA